MKNIYKDDLLEINISKDADMTEYPNIADVLFCEALVWFKTWVSLAKDPVENWAKVRKALDTYLDIMEWWIKDLQNKKNWL